MASLQAAYAIDKTWTVVASADYLSGDSGDSDKYKAFNVLYGTHHKFYGAMDYFYASDFKTDMLPGYLTNVWVYVSVLPIRWIWT